LKAKSEALQNGIIVEEEEEEEEESDIEEELGYFSALDSIDPYIAFKQALTGIVSFIVLSLAC
jgi:hypothetical protein